MTEDKDTLINGQKIRVQALLQGEVLRVGNTQMRLDPDAEVKEEDIVEADEVVDPNDVVEAEVVADEEPIGVVEDAQEVVEVEPEPEPVPRLAWKELDK